MMKYVHVYVLFLLFVLCTSCEGQKKTDLLKDNIKSETKGVTTSYGPNSIVRTIKQDRKGNIWIASWEGVFRYDGKSFINMTSEVSSSHFFSVLEDRKGNFWFSSVGSGVYYYDGKSFRNFTSKDGLANDRVTEIYEDRAGNIWFSTEGGASRYDGQSFRNFTTKDGLPNNDVSSIIEDETGKFWFGTRENTCIFDGKTFTILTHDGIPFRNVRAIIEDKNGHIWLGGNDGFWRYNGSTFINYSAHFVGCVYEDKTGNIWTGSIHAYGQGWALSRYDAKTWSNDNPTVTKIKSGEGMIFGILEARDGSIWFGTLNGVYRYDGSTITSFDVSTDPITNNAASISSTRHRL